MKYGIHWYAGVGEHDYEVTGSNEYASMGELLGGLLAHGSQLLDEDLVFDALHNGPQDVIYWITDDYGFAFYRVQ